MQKKTPHKSAGHKQSEFKDISTAAQRQRLLEALREGPVTTIQAREQFDVMHPAGRVKELRARGYNILTFWHVVETVPGVKHRVARYMLVPGAYEGRAA